MPFAAHIRLSDNEIQSVQAHCTQTASLASGYAEKFGLQNTARLAGILHDIGKFTADFDAYIRGIVSFRRGELDHSFAGAKYLMQLVADSDNRNLQKAAALIGRVILSHHGLHDWVTEDAEDTFAIRTSKEKYYAEIMHNLAQTDFPQQAEKLLIAATDEVSAARTKLRQIAGESKETFAFYLGMLERLLQSVLIDADRTDTASFMSNSQTEQHFDTASLWTNMQNNMQKMLRGFSAKTDVISKQRQSISDRCAAFAAHHVGICKLIVPTGGGKTLSSLRFAIEYAKQHPIEKIIYIAPFMSILEQNSDIIRSIAGEDAFLEHHSNILAEVSGDTDALHNYELRTEKWDSPVIATTMVQFLNALFSGKSSAVRRMHRLSRAVIIVDEVQSVPLKCVYLFDLAMNFLSQICGSAVVLCSATQPPFEQMTKFPLLLDTQSSMTGDTDADFAVFRRTALIYPQKKGGYSFDEAADFGRQCFRENGSLLFVVNTKKAAKELYLRLKETDGAAVYHLSTNMCPQHRREIIAAIREKLSAHVPVICVTTQLIEAGVDISFGCVVRSLAGLDHAAQAAGRCNRSGEFHRICPVYLIHIHEEVLGSLHEIGIEQNIAREMLEMPEDTDFLSVSLQTAYFKMLYNRVDKDNRDPKRYLLNNTCDKDLINLLALNEHRTKTRLRHLQFCGQAFKTAGGLFQVIDSHAADVIVPYDDDAKDLIATLESERNPGASVDLLRRLQKYAVSIYTGTERVLCDAAAIRTIQCGDTDCIVRVLDTRFYDAAFGVTTEGGEREVLLF